jgi:hypothetical protein
VWTVLGIVIFPLAAALAAVTIEQPTLEHLQAERG